MLECPTCGRRYSSDFEICPDDQSALQADSTVAGDEPVDPLIGQTLDDKYRVEDRLGIGGMGTVYRARHMLIDRPVAVKVLNARFVEDDTARARFRREAKAAGSLQHVNAVTVTDFGQTSDGYVYLVMELLEGRTLRDIVAKEAPLDVGRAVALMLQASAAVAAAHDAGIIHRDLKPANIFIVQRADMPAQVKVLDFGIAKLATESLDDDDPKTLTQVGAMIGTPKYMSPEQCDGLELTPAADVYSLGCILYEMLTGTVPFSGSTPLAIAMRHTSEVPRGPREYVASIPEELEAVVLHALEKNPVDRPANATEFRLELQETASRLGLEYSTFASTPDIDALRSVATESPSGRLLVDISKLRESRAAVANEATVIQEKRLTMAPSGATSEPLPTSHPEFPRVSVSFSRWKRPQLVVGALVLAALLIGLAFAIRSRSGALISQPIAAASPNPTVEPTPSPTPTPSPSPSPRRAADRTAGKQKKDSRAGSVLKKVKRIFTKPF